LIDEWFMVALFQHDGVEGRRLVWLDVALIADEDLGRAGCRGRRRTGCGLSAVVIVDILTILSRPTTSAPTVTGGINAHAARLIRRVRLKPVVVGPDRWIAPIDLEGAEGYRRA
jgi:hypothetical protein